MVLQFNPVNLSMFTLTSITLIEHTVIGKAYTDHHIYHTQYMGSQFTHFIFTVWRDMSW